jgi:hypothetical protein
MKAPLSFYRVFVEPEHRSACVRLLALGGDEKSVIYSDWFSLARDWALEARMGMGILQARERHMIEISNNACQLSSRSPLMSKTPTIPNILSGKEFLRITFRAMLSKTKSRPNVRVNPNAR